MRRSRTRLRRGIGSLLCSTTSSSIQASDASAITWKSRSCRTTCRLSRTSILRAESRGPAEQPGADRSTTSSSIQASDASAITWKSRSCRTTCRLSRTSILRAESRGPAEQPGAPSGVSAPDAVLLRFPLFLEASPLGGDLLPDLVDLVGVRARKRLLKALLEEDLPLGNPAEEHTVNVGKLGALLGRQRFGRSGVRLGRVER